MKAFEHGGNIYRKSPQQGRWLDFSANINPLGLSEKAYQAVADHIGAVVHYPDPDAKELKAALAEAYNLSEDQLVLGNGAAELFYLFLQTVRPKRVLLPVPSFSEYERAALAARCKVSYFQLEPEEAFRLDREKLTAALPVADCIILGNPNNPTGGLVTRNELTHLLEEMKGGRQWLVVDESFLDFLRYDTRYTVRDLTKEYPHLFVVRSLTKFYALPGLRLGFGAASPDLADKLNQGKDVWNVNVLAQQAGIAVLRDRDYQKRSREELAEWSSSFYQQLADVQGIRPLKPSVNFILLDISGTAMSSTELTDVLSRKGILVRDCANYPGLDGRSYIRVAVRTPEENKRFLTALEEISW
ncbi:threonine-phosphate decarboxylase CobD [Selenomonas montiformis]|uniref:threonine-phosphate decarboxylase n=1 Tax=Selenomonas montiformis TaxID=2652285 RepID=A0A6I2V102_9FIRM|nr:threonine-phosphate decarboxylase CobD [Selenomonas montiformis]MDY4697622.1 threonine-phosphate decarboxylase CobD [Selenomonas montiformis]MSV25142.1 threonine-phosphate decarboxylase [Selenomonas montiformis]